MTAPAVLIAPSLLSADFTDLGREVAEVERAGADWLHVDVMDGHFVPNLTVGPVVIRWIKRRARRPMDVHLMMENPVEYIPVFAKAGAWNLTVHWEVCRGDTSRVLRLIRRHGCRAGITVRPGTPIQRVKPYLKESDLALVMTVEPGFGGQSFMPDMLPKVRWLRDEYKRLRKRAWIEVDGGINTSTAPLVVGAGANVLVAGNAIFAKDDRARALKALRRAAGRAAF